MTSLHDITGFNKYCGPAVLSALTGKSTDTCAAVIGSISGKTSIRGVDLNHLTEAAKRLGCEVESIRVPSGTLFGCLAALNGKEGKYIVSVPHHVVAVEISDRIYLIDNHTKNPINAASSARLTQRVDYIWQVKPKPAPSLEEIKRDRISLLRKAVDDLNIEISSRVNRREQILRELKELENGQRA